MYKYLAGLLALAVLLAGTVTGASAATIKSIAISSSEDVADASPYYGIGATEVYAIISYTEATGESIAVVVHGPGLPYLYSSPAKQYSDSGTDAIEISGTTLYQRLVKLVRDESVEAQGNARKANTQNSVFEYLAMVLRSSSNAGDAVDLLLTLTEADALTVDQIQQLKDISSAAAEVAALATEANELPADDLSGKQALAGQMAEPAAAMVEAADELWDQASTVTEMPLPVTGLEAEGFTVTAEVGGLPSSSTSFNVGQFANAGDLQATPTPTSASSDQVTPRSSAANSATATARAAGIGGSNDSTSGDSGTSSSGDSGTTSGVILEGGGTAESGLAGIRSQTATPRSQATPSARVPGALGSSDSGSEASPPTPSGDEYEFGEPVSEGVSVQPTWTPAAQSFEPRTQADADAGAEDEQGPDAGSAGTGPDLLVLAAGAIVLVGLALWMRRSM